MVDDYEDLFHSKTTSKTGKNGKLEK